MTGPKVTSAWAEVQPGLAWVGLLKVQVRVPGRRVKWGGRGGSECGCQSECGCSKFVVVMIVDDDDDEDDEDEDDNDE